MERVQICKYIKNYSKIEKIQTEHQVIYSAEALLDDIFLSVVHIQPGQEDYSVKCQCSGILPDHAKNIMLFMYENSIDVGGFLDVLQELSVKYTEIDPSF